MKLFKRKKRNHKKNEFLIEYYPENEKYLVKVNGNYLNQPNTDGFYRLTNWIMLAEKFKTEEKARKAIEKFKEQIFKKTVKIIPVD